MSDPAADPNWVTYVEAATLAGMSVHWVRDHANAGEIRRLIATDGTRRRFVSRADLGQLLAARAAARAARFPKTATPPADGWISLRDAAAELRSSRSYITKLVGLGEMEGRLVATAGRHPAAYVRADQVAEIQLRKFGGRPDEVVTYSEAAAEYGLSVEQIRRRVRWGQLHPVGQGRHPRLLRAEAVALTLMRCNASKEPQAGLRVPGRPLTETETKGEERRPPRD